MFYKNISKGSTFNKGNNFNKGSNLNKGSTFNKARALANVLLTSVIVLPITTIITTNEVIASNSNTNAMKEIVDECFKTNINEKANLLNNNSYWAKKAIENKNNKWSSSIENLKKIFERAMNDCKNEYAIPDKDFIKKFQKICKDNYENNQTLINEKNEKLLFSYMNYYMIYDTLWCIFYNNEESREIKNLSKEELTKQFYNSAMRLKEEVLQRTDDENNGNLNVYEDVVFNIFESNDKYSKYKIDKTIVSEEPDSKKFSSSTQDWELRFFSFLKHDWDCYLTQFGVICDIRRESLDSNGKKIIGILKSHRINGVIKVIQQKLKDALIAKDRKKKYDYIKEILGNDSFNKFCSNSDIKNENDLTSIYDAVFQDDALKLAISEKDIINGFCASCNKFSKVDFEKKYGKELDYSTWGKFLKNLIAFTYQKTYLGVFGRFVQKGFIKLTEEIKNYEKETKTFDRKNSDNEHYIHNYMLSTEDINAILEFYMDMSSVQRMYNNAPRINIDESYNKKKHNERKLLFDKLNPILEELTTSIKNKRSKKYIFTLITKYVLFKVIEMLIAYYDTQDIYKNNRYNEDYLSDCFDESKNNEHQEDDVKELFENQLQNQIEDIMNYLKDVKCGETDCGKIIANMIKEDFSRNDCTEDLIKSNYGNLVSCIRNDFYIYIDYLQKKIDTIEANYKEQNEFRCKKLFGDDIEKVIKIAEIDRSKPPRLDTLNDKKESKNSLLIFFNKDNYKELPDKLADYLLKNDDGYRASGIKKDVLKNIIDGLYSNEINSRQKSIKFVSKKIFDKVINPSIKSVINFFIDTFDDIVANPKGSNFKMKTVNYKTQKGMNEKLGLVANHNELSLLDYADVLNALNDEIQKGGNTIQIEKRVREICVETDNKRRCIEDDLFRKKTQSKKTQSPEGFYYKELESKIRGVAERCGVHTEKLTKIGELAEECIFQIKRAPKYAGEFTGLTFTGEVAESEVFESVYNNWRSLPKDIKWNLEKSKEFVKKELDKINYNFFLVPTMMQNPRN